MKYLKNPINRKIGIYGLGQVIQQSVSFLLLPILVNHLTESEYGSYSTLFALGGLLSILYSMSIDKSIYRLYHDYSDEQDRKIYLFNVVILFVIGSLLVLISSWILLQEIDVLKSIDFYPLIALTLFLFYLDSFRKILVAILRVVDKTEIFFFLIVFHVILKLGGVSFVLIVKNGTLEDLFYTLLIVDFCLILATILFIRKSLKPKFRKEHILATFVFTLPLIPTVLLAWALNFSDRLFIEYFIGLKEVGHYNLMYRIAMVSSLLSNSYYAAISPEFYKMAKSGNIVGMKKLLRTYFFIVAFLSGLVLLTAKQAIILISPESYHYATFLVPIIVIAYFFSMMTGVFNLFVYQVKQTKQILIIYIIITLINLSINILFIKEYGLIIPALSTLITYIINYIIMYIYTKKIYFIDFGINKRMAQALIMIVLISILIYV